jgi:hypothetical protein
MTAIGPLQMPGRRTWRPVTEVLRARRLPLIATAVIDQKHAQRLFALGVRPRPSVTCRVTSLSNGALSIGFQP